MKKDKLVAINIGEPIIKVKHKELQRDSEDSIYRSTCPVCKEGILLVRRNQATLELLALDNCILCGQIFEYTDLGVKE